MTLARLLTPAEAAELLRVKPSTIYEWTRTGRMPCLRLGRAVRFTPEMIERWALAQLDEGRPR